MAGRHYDSRVVEFVGRSSAKCGFIVIEPADMRTAQQVAKRAVILGTLWCRGSMEVDDHTRVAVYSQRLLPWLSEVGCEDEIDPIEQEELGTPLGQLSDSQWIDVNWSGESALLFCWMLNLAPPPDKSALGDPSILARLLCILRPQAVEVILNARLREPVELEDMCRHIGLVLSLLRESRIGGEGAAILRALHVRRLTAAGLTITDEVVERATAVFDGMTPEQRIQVAGCYPVREHAALWFLSDRRTYFEPPDD